MTDSLSYQNENLKVIGFFKKGLLVLFTVFLSMFEMLPIFMHVKDMTMYMTNIDYLEHIYIN